MAIKNYICKGCNHQFVCKIFDQISKFSNEAKKPLGVNIKILECQEYHGEGETLDE